MSDAAASRLSAPQAVRDDTAPAPSADARDRTAPLPPAPSAGARDRTAPLPPAPSADARDRAAPLPPVPAARTRTRAPARRSWRWAPRAGLAGALAALLLALVLVPGDRSVVEQAAALAHEPPTQRSPAAPVEGVRFPDWSREFGWHARGARHDALDGRVTTTVFYEHMGHRLAYTILPGRPAEPPAGARIVRRNGVEIALYRDGEHDVAVFERDGRTCVLAGHVLRESTLVKLAAWRA